MNSNEYFAKAVKLYNENNIKEAINIYKSLLNFNKKYYVYYNLGICYIDLKDYKKAIEAFEKAIKLNYLHVESYINLAYCYYKLKDYKNCYRIIKIGNTYTSSTKLQSIENKLIKVVIYGG
ncbi:MAG: tetratricopeptide repeat protein [Clostridiales bacterium]|nr:tetratricopeptide repeat protein [Clostridiales bacterium]